LSVIANYIFTMKLFFSNFFSFLNPKRRYSLTTVGAYSLKTGQY
jgi:hypothetical protein